MYACMHVCICMHACILCMCMYVHILYVYKPRGSYLLATADFDRALARANEALASAKQSIRVIDLDTSSELLVAATVASGMYGRERERDRELREREKERKREVYLRERNHVP